MLSRKRPLRGVDCGVCARKGGNLTLCAQNWSTPQRYAPTSQVRAQSPKRKPHTYTPSSAICAGGVPFRDMAMYQREYARSHPLAVEAVERLLSTPFPDRERIMETEIRRLRRPSARTAAVAARSGIATSLAAEAVSEAAADLENDEAAARPRVEKKTCPFRCRVVPKPRVRVYGSCNLPHCKGDEVYKLSCGHLVCLGCWEGMPLHKA